MKVAQAESILKQKKHRMIATFTHRQVIKSVLMLLPYRANHLVPRFDNPEKENGIAARRLVKLNII